MSLYLDVVVFLHKKEQPPPDPPSEKCVIEFTPPEAEILPFFSLRLKRFDPRLAEGRCGYNGFHVKNLPVGACACREAFVRRGKDVGLLRETATTAKSFVYIIFFVDPS